MQTQRRILLSLLGLVCGLLVSGCATFTDRKSSDSSASASAAGGDVVSSGVHRASYEEPEDDVREKKPLEWKDFYPSNLGTTVKELTGNGPNHEIARQLYGEGEDFYRQAVDARAKDSPAGVQSLFLEASDRFAGAASRWPDSALEEDALFRAAESQFFADRYVKSNDYFEQLLKKYPNTRYLDLVGARRFLIAQYWIQWDGDPQREGYGLNVTDKGRPWSDTFGHGVRVYDRMRLDDPTGKLADDATIAAANAYLAKGDFAKADQYYSDLRTHFPSSEHQFMAHYLGVQAKLRGYRGPEFTGDALDQADKLIKQIRRQFPTESQKYQNELDRAYKEVRYKKAEREWKMAEYYFERKEYGAARFYYDIVLKDYADTPFAPPARERLPKIAGKPRAPAQKLAWLVNLFPDTKTPQPLMATSPDQTKRR